MRSVAFGIVPMVCGVIWIAGWPDDDCTVTLTCPRTTGDGGSAGAGSGGMGAQGGGGGQGVGCETTDDCAVGSCVDAFCCDTLCDGICEACDVQGLQGTCSPSAAGADPNSECGNGTCDGSGACAAGSHIWSHQFGDADPKRALAAHATRTGNIVVAGMMEGTLDIGGGFTYPSAGFDDLFVAMLGSDGSPLWLRGFGDATSQGGFLRTMSASSTSAGEAVVAVYTQGNFSVGPTNHVDGGAAGYLLLMKLQASGFPAWSLSFDGAFHQIGGVAVGPTGTITVGGGFRGTIDFGGGPTNPTTGNLLGDAYLATLSVNGAEVWVKHYEAVGDQGLTAVAVDAQGNVVVAGICFANGQMDLGDGPFQGGFVAKMDPDGNLLWSVKPGAIFAPSGIATNDDGVVAIAGASNVDVDFGAGPLSNQGELDAVVAVFNPDGSHRWSGMFGDGAAQSARDVAVDDDGNVIVTGNFYGNVDFGGGMLTANGGIEMDGGDAFIAKFAADGTHLWSYRYGDSADQRPFATTVDTSGNVIAAGGFLGSVNFGGNALPNSGGEDIFVFKLSP